jgi:hypothetical protein
MKLRIVNDDGRGFNTKVYIDDQDVSECFRAVRIEAGLTGPVTAELEAVACEVQVGDVLQLKLPNEGTRDLLIKHGWTPPAEPVEVPVVRRKTAGVLKSKTVRGAVHDPLDIEADLFTADGEQISGRELLNRFFERVQREWEPGEGDELTVNRAYDMFGNPVPGKRTYSLTLTLGTDRDQ